MGKIGTARDFAHTLCQLHIAPSECGAVLLACCCHAKDIARSQCPGDNPKVFTDLEKVRTAIRELCRARRCRELTAHSGMSRSAIMRIASGQTQNPSYETILRILRAVEQLRRR